MIDIGSVLEVVQREQAVFLEVALRHDQVTALVRWAPPYHGPGFGHWWVPDVGADVLCAFPGRGPDGATEDFDEGYAFAVVSSMPEPPVAGLQGPLDPTRRVFKGRLGEAQDDHYQGAHDIEIEGPQRQLLKSTRDTTVVGAETRFFQATRSAVVEGTETRTTGGVFSWTYQAAANFLGQALLRIISQAEVRIDAPEVKLGSESALRKIVHDAFVALFNAHTHGEVSNGPGVTGPPIQQMTVGVHTSTRTKVDG